MNEEILPLEMLNKAATLSGYAGWQNCINTSSAPIVRAVKAHARTLVELVKYKPDPVLVAAQEICAMVASELNRREQSASYRDGTYNNEPEVRATVAIIRKLMEAGHD